MICVQRQSFVTLPATDPSAVQATGMAVAAVLKGAHIIRLEDVAAARDAILAADGLLAAAEPQLPLTGIRKTSPGPTPVPEPPPEPRRKALRPPVKR